jgi:hypothetical protein
MAAELEKTRRRREGGVIAALTLHHGDASASYVEHPIETARRALLAAAERCPESAGFRGPSIVRGAHAAKPGRCPRSRTGRVVQLRAQAKTLTPGRPAPLSLRAAHTRVAHPFPSSRLEHHPAGHPDSSTGRARAGQREQEPRRGSTILSAWRPLVVSD